MKAGARIVEDLHETAYGELQYGVEDLEGHHWLFSRHARDVTPMRGERQSPTRNSSPLVPNSGPRVHRPLLVRRGCRLGSGCGRRRRSLILRQAADVDDQVLYLVIRRTALFFGRHLAFAVADDIEKFLVQPV